MERSEYLAAVERVVVKVGTAVVTGADGTLDADRVSALAEQIDKVVSGGRQVVLVTSGAIGAGVGELGLAQRPSALPELQAAASVGQSHLIEAYNRCFRRHGHHAAQILVTREDFDDRTRYLNVRNALNALFELGAIPVVNENDTVSVDEIRFGDNDLLSALVASLLGVQLLVLLTVVDGLLDDGGHVVPCVERVTDETLALDHGRKTALGTGGMSSKLEAVRLVTDAGEAAIIADGGAPDVLPRLMAGDELGTFFLPRPRRTPSWKRWFAARTSRGTIHVDEGAKKALVERGKSLLPSGIVSVSGSFEQGDTVQIAGPDGRAFAQGLTNLSAAELNEVRGMQSHQVREALGDAAYTEAVHRDNMLIRK
ncbi:MAG: glutamate 5-kinase [Planctomycetota bacterium]